MDVGRILEFFPGDVDHLRPKSLEGVAKLAFFVINPTNFNVV